MLSMANVRSPSAAASYFASDNYYARADADRSGQWIGEGAERLGLNWTAWYDARLCENATDTRCFPCGDAKSKECAVGAAEECT